MPGEVSKIYELRVAPSPWTQVPAFCSRPALFNFIPAPKQKKKRFQVSGSQEFIVFQLRNLFVAVNFQFFRSSPGQAPYTYLSAPARQPPSHCQFDFHLIFYFAPKLQLFGNCFYNTTKQLGEEEQSVGLWGRGVKETAWRRKNGRRKHIEETPEIKLCKFCFMCGSECVCVRVSPTPRSELGNNKTEACRSVYLRLLDWS